ncbi:CHASE3 domain-containing protein [Planotetraspora thailandica]|uniref:CHASE3 domain-containing protein n=1 Tax=Planotetraspora thailandica TaxID=487172 RepID=UPI00194F6C00|nr:CHASE3 domain-containing protein [Planotetraspora thailandica]
MIFIGGAFAALTLAIAGLREAMNLQKSSGEALQSAYYVEKLVIDLETGQRGFIITGDERFLQPWYNARAALPQQTATLQQRAATRHASQGEQARRLTQTIDSYIRDYSVPTVEAARQDPASTRTVAVTEEGKHRLDGIRNQFHHFVASERKLLVEHQERATAAGRWATVGAAAGVAVSALLILAFNGYVIRSIVRPVRRASVMACDLADGDLSVRMPATEEGEIGDLQRALNTMASSLEAGRAELAASRARVVAAADESRRRIERDLHDGTQQRLVSLALLLRRAEEAVPSGQDELKKQLSRTTDDLADIIEELHELSRGIHPAILSKGGLAPSLRALARRSAVPVELNVGAWTRLAERIEVTAYYVVSEALTNAAKHARASTVHVDLTVEDSALRLSVRDDGVGGADPRQGSGLIGLMDRVEAIGGSIHVESPAGKGTSLFVTIPLTDDRPITPGDA